MIYLLGLLAKAGHGKTTVARHLVRAHDAEEQSLAGPLKRAVQQVFGFTDAQLWGTQEQKSAVDARYGFSARWLLQRLGTEGLRDNFGPDIHQRALLHAVRRREAARPAGAPPRLYVVDDVRFPDDAHFIAAGGPDFRGAVLKIVATDAPPTGPHAAHASERAIDEVPAADVAATLLVRRADGIAAMLAGVDEALRSAPGLAPLHAALPPPVPAEPPVARQ